MDINECLELIIKRYCLDKEYRELKRAGLNVLNHGGVVNQYSRIIGDNSCYLYLEMYLIQDIANNTQDMGKRFFAWKACVYLAMKARNFVCLEFYIKKLEDNPKEREKYHGLWEDIQELLNKIKIALKKRRKKDIIVFWLDAIGNHEKGDMVYLNKEMERGISFEEAYTVTPHTKPTVRSIFCRKRVFDDKSYKIERIDETNSCLLGLLKKEGYICRILSGTFEPMFSQNCLSELRHEIWDPCGVLLWDVLQEMLKSEKALFVLVHILEAHAPCVYSKISERTLYNQILRYREAKQEIDEQLKFYGEFLPAEVQKIYMSDHGNTHSFYPMQDNFHVLLGVRNTFNSKLKIDSLFSLEDFGVLIDAIINGRNVKKAIPNRKYVDIQELDYYSKVGNRAIIYEKWKLRMRYFGHKGIITKDYMYLVFRTGKEWLVSKNSTAIEPELYDQKEDICNKTILIEIRKLVSDFPSDIDSDTYFWYSNYKYKLYAGWKACLNRRIGLIEKELSRFEVESIAVRMGGRHSWILFHLLSEPYRKRIHCFIDKDKMCYCADIGLPIMDINAIDTKKIKGIILSTYMHLNELRIEVLQYPETVEIIDIYKLFSMNNIEAKQDFYKEIPEGVYRKLQLEFSEQECLEKNTVYHDINV